MKKFINRLTLVNLCCLLLSVSAISFTKAGNKPGNGSNDGTHSVDPQLAGNWMWSQAGDGAYYDDNGSYHGPSYGFATKFSVNADGYGTCFEHMFSTLGPGTDFTVDISYKGFFETDNQGHLGFFPTSGTYKSGRGENRSLRADELWNVSKNTGRNLLFQKVTFTTQGRTPVLYSYVKRWNSRYIFQNTIRIENIYPPFI